MSNIPEARRILKLALNSGDLRTGIEQALALMTRKSPTFIAPRKIAPLNPTEIGIARHLRSRGLSLNEIARRLGTNIGRISEATNP